MLNKINFPRPNLWSRKRRRLISGNYNAKVGKEDNTEKVRFDRDCHRLNEEECEARIKG